MTSEDQLKGKVAELQHKIRYLEQLRPLIDNGDGYSYAISFEQMSEYAILWMEQEGLFKNKGDKK